MATETAYPHIDAGTNAPARLARLPRIRVAQIVMDSIAHGWSVDEMCCQHSHLIPAEVHAAMTYYYDHQQEIDEEIREELEELGALRDQGSQSPFYLRMKAKGLL